MRVELPIRFSEDFKMPVSQTAKRVLTSYKRGVKFLCGSGMRSCGKTTAFWIYALFLCLSIPGLKVYIGRLEYATLTESVIETLDKHILYYGIEDERNPWRLRGTKFRPERMIFPNSSQIIFTSLLDPQKVKGKEPSLFWINEGSRLKDIEALVTIAGSQVAGRSGAWFLKNMPFSQIIIDTNPDAKSNWLWQLFHPDEEDEDIEALGLDLSRKEWLSFQLLDNPAYSDNGRIRNKLGEQALSELLETHPPGVFRDRYVFGLWVAAEGAVYGITEANILRAFPSLDNCRFFRACDWGMTHPSVCLWIAEHKITKDVFVFREWRKTHSDADEIPKAINAYTDEPIETTVIDNNEARQKELRKHGIASVRAFKGAGSVMDRVLLVNAALRRAQEGKPGGLYIYKDLVCNRDPNPAVDRSRNSLVKEMQNLQFAVTGDRPEKEHDDASDALGYFYIWRSQKRAVSGHGASVKVKREGRRSFRR